MTLQQNKKDLAQAFWLADHVSTSQGQDFSTALLKYAHNQYGLVRAFIRDNNSTFKEALLICFMRSQINGLVLDKNVDNLLDEKTI